MLLLDAHMFLVTAHSYLQSCDVESIWTRIGMVDMDDFLRKRMGSNGSSAKSG